MPSNALHGLLIGLEEIKALQRANPSPQEGSGLRRPEIVRAIGRSEVVLLSSHFERYIYDLYEEAVDYLCCSNARATTLPEKLKLQHARQAMDDIAAMNWERRAASLAQYSKEESWLWDEKAPIGKLDAGRLLVWMKTPNVKSLRRAFQIWDIDDIFSAITRSSVHRGRLILRIDELVSKRNNIAHGDFSAEATYLDIAQYRAAVRKFCTRADRALARQLHKFTKSVPW
ncbi:MAE_28990/MAE_18760 family HEPN-like nuclease [Amycolatopsis sp. NPDC058986]